MTTTSDKGSPSRARRDKFVCGGILLLLGVLCLALTLSYAASVRNSDGADGTQRVWIDPDPATAVEEGGAVASFLLFVLGLCAIAGGFVGKSRTRAREQQDAKESPKWLGHLEETSGPLDDHIRRRP